MTAGVQPDVRPAERLAGRPAGRPGGARVVSGAEKKSFDRGGPVWPPRSNVMDDRYGEGVLGRLCPPQPKFKKFEFPRNRFLVKALPRKAVKSM